MSVNNSYDEATCGLRASSPLRHEENRGTSATVHANGRSQLCVTGDGKETHPQRMHLAEVKYHTVAINKRAGTLALE